MRGNLKLHSVLHIAFVHIGSQSEQLLAHFLLRIKKASPAISKAHAVGFVVYFYNIPSHHHLAISLFLSWFLLLSLLSCALVRCWANTLEEAAFH